MIKITREQLLNSEKTLGVLANTKMPISVSFRLNRIIKQAATELQETEKIRQEILKKYGKKNAEDNLIIDKATGYVEISDENRKLFTKEVNLLFSEECELIGDPIDIKLLEEVKMTSQEIASIEPFLKFE